MEVVTAMLSDGPKDALARSPLAEAIPTSLEEIFSAAPPFSERDMEVIVTSLREARKRWLSDEASGAKKPSAAAAKRAPKMIATDSLSLDDLDL